VYIAVQRLPCSVNFTMS